MKAQIWSIDFILSVVIFVTMIVLVFFSFNLLSLDASSQSGLAEMQDRALEATEALVRAPGIPGDWTPATVQVVGLATEENVLDQAKVLSFLALDYAASKPLIGIAEEEYYFRVEYPNRSVITLQGLLVEKGPSYAGAMTLVSVERYVLLDGINRLVLYLWM